MIYDFFREAYSTGKKLLIVLIDPQVINEKPDLLERYIKVFNKSAPSLVFVGGSLVFDSTDDVVTRIKDETGLPVVLFPGHFSQITPAADAILFMSLISGRNPEFLIGQQVVAAPVVKNAGMEAIPTGYILVDGGTHTSVEYVSQSKPIPPGKTDILKATALAGQMLGHKLVYIEGGSGAGNVLPPGILREVVNYVNIPVIVGGGINTPEQALRLFDAGAVGVVIGTALENEPEKLMEFVTVVGEK